MGQKKQFLEIVLFSLEAVFDGGQLTVVAHSFLLEPLDDLLIGLLDGLGLVVLDHHLIEPVLQDADGSHHGVFLDEAQLVVLDLLQLVLEGEEHVFLDFGLVLFLVEHDSEVVLIGGRSAELAARACRVVGRPREDGSALLVGDELVPHGLQLLVLPPELVDLFLVLFLDFLGLEQEEPPVLLQHLVLLVLVLHLVVDGAGLADHG